jgi:hypothetical protein
VIPSFRLLWQWQKRRKGFLDVREYRNGRTFESGWPNSHCGQLMTQNGSLERGGRLSFQKGIVQTFFQVIVRKLLHAIWLVIDFECGYCHGTQGTREPVQGTSTACICSKISTLEGNVARECGDGLNEVLRKQTLRTRRVDCRKRRARRMRRVCARVATSGTGAESVPSQELPASGSMVSRPRSNSPASGGMHASVIHACSLGEEVSTIGYACHTARRARRVSFGCNASARRSASSARDEESQA